MSKEAIKLALEALEAATRYGAGGFEDAKDALREALAEQTAQQEPVAKPHEQEPQKLGISGSPSDPEICNERSAQACGPVYCGDSGGYCNNCPKQKIIQAVKSCNGMNCGCTDGRSHSLECHAEHAAAIAGGVFVQSLKPAMQQEPLASCNGMPAYEGPLSKTQRTWVGLTDDEIWDAYVRSPVCVNDSSLVHLYAFGRVIEAKLKEKNT